MSGLVDELVEAVLCEPKESITKQAEDMSAPASPDWEELASELEKQAEEDLHIVEREKSVVSDGVRMQKLAMATILDVIDDPKYMPAIEKISSDAQDLVKSAMDAPEPGSVGELAQIANTDGPTYVKHPVGKGRTLFEKMNTGIVSAPNVVAEDK